MKSGPKIPFISDEQIIDLLINKKMTDLKAGEALGVSRSTIAVRRNQLNIPTKPKNNPSHYVLSLEQDKELCELYSKDLNDYEVSAIMHIGRNKLREWRRNHGIPSRTNKKNLNPDICKTVIKRHNNGESFEKIARDFNVTHSSIVKLLNRNGYNYRKKRTTPVLIKNYSLTKKQISILVGDLFGDGHIAISSSKKAYYFCAHKKDQEAFVVWKFNAFKPLSSRLYIGDQKDNRKPDQDREGYVSMSTWSSEIFKLWKEKFYPLKKGDKIISPYLVEFLDPLGLAVWYMGDGSLYKETGVITINKKIDFKPICEALNNKFGKIFKAKLYERQWTLTVTNPDNFFKLICPYIINNMKYKIPEKYHKYCTSCLIDFGYIYKNSNFSKHDYAKLNDKEKRYLIEDAVSYYKHRRFPYPRYSEKEQKLDFSSLVNNSIKILPENILIYGNSGMKICNHFFPHRYDTARYDGRAMDLWNNDVLFEKFIKNRLKYFDGTFSDSTIRTGLALKGIPSNFSPLIAKYIYETYLPYNGKTLDFSAGYGGRLLGYIASGKGSEYIGIEPWTESYRSLLKMSRICTSWNNINSESIIIHNDAFENVSFEENSFDLIFSSPPYYDLEIYGNEDTQSIKRYPEYNNWLKKFWHVVIDRCFNYIKNNGYFIFSVANYSHYDLIDDTKKFIRNYSYKELSPLRMSYHNVYKNKDKLENIFIFQKRIII